MNQKKKISGEIYLVIDPSMKEAELLKIISSLKGEDIAALQVWDNFASVSDKEELVVKIIQICSGKDIPVLINNDWQLAKAANADGVHFDEIPENLDFVRKELKKDSLFGLTCNNDLEVISQAEKLQLDYISFCSIFPSGTSNSCELVSFDTLKKARELTRLPIFLAGGIKPENICKLAGVDFEGVAVISGIMGAEKPAAATREYLTQIKKIRK